MPASIPLDRLQRWMQSVVVHAGSIEQALGAPEAVREVEGAAAVIRPSKTLTPAERVEIYHAMYPLRMEEALATDYPALKHFLGGPGFFELAQQYVRVYPSRCYTLNRLGDHMPEFLKNAAERKHQAFLVDLARLELAVTEVFDERETSALSEAGIAALKPEDWEHAVLRPVAALRLVDLRYNANDYVQALKDEQRAPRPKQKPTWVAIYRKQFAVYRQELSRPAYELLAELVAGAALGAAIQAALLRDARRRPHPDQLSRWFRDWVAAGMFASVATTEA